MAWWTSLLSWFVKSGAAEATGKAIVSKVTKKKKDNSGGAAKD